MSMKVLVLCKQAPQGRDLLERPYGRFFHLPLFLAQQGMDVSVLLLNYKTESAIYQQQHGIHWYSESIIPWRGAYLQRLHQIIQRQRPDWIIGFSDTYYGILAQRIGKQYGIRSLIDAYDNYESYLSWCKPLHHVWRQALQQATVVTAAGQALADMMSCKRLEKAKIIPMAADPIFQPMDQKACRQALKLPQHKQIIGYTGSLHDNRGVDILCRIAQAFQYNSDIVILVTGRQQSQISLPANVLQLGYLPDKAMPQVMNALDVLLVLNNNSSFGNYSYPVKLYEAMACQIPAVCADVTGTREILGHHSFGLAVPRNVDDFIRKIQSALSMGRHDYGIQQGWGSIGLQFINLLIS